MPLPWLLALFFLSGCSSLIYEVVWTRLFADVLGSTTVSVAVVFSVFLLGLAAGAAHFGESRSRGTRALRLYGQLELGIGASALVVGVALTHLGHQIAELSPGPGSTLLSPLYSFAIAAGILGVPTFLMGGTLPIVLNAVPTAPRTAVTALYGWNTIGAALGAVLAGFFLIWWVGLSRTVYIAGGVNLVVGSLALGTAGPRTAAGPANDGGDASTSQDASRTVDPLWLVLAFLSGASVLALEVLWSRIGHFLLGDRTLAISALLGVVILSLGLASLAVPALAAAWGATSQRRVHGILGALLLGGAALHGVTVPLAALTAQGVGLAAASGLLSSTPGRVLVVAVLAGPPFLVLGCVFPLLAWSARALDRAPATVIGRLYLVSTVGGVLGAGLAGFLLVRRAGTLGGFAVVAAALVVAGGALLGPLLSSLRGRFGLAGAAVLATGLAVLRPGTLVRLRPDESFVEAREDEYGVQVAARTSEGYLRVRNNRLSLIFDLGHPQTTHAQQMAAHLTVLLAGEARSVLNVGTGYGITAGTYTLYDTPTTIETVEILPFLIDLQPLFQPYNLGILEDPRVRMIHGDGRHVLLASDRRYDIISVNVLDPYLPGSASLYTVDFWEEARERLRPGGVFTQLFWGADVGLLVRGLEQVFPEVLYFEAYGGTSFNVVAFRDAHEGPVEATLSRLTARAREQLVAVGGGVPEEILPELLRRARANAIALSRLAARTTGPLHTDDHPVLEYRWANGAAGISALDSPLVQY